MNERNIEPKKRKRVWPFLKRGLKYSCIAVGLFVLVLLIGMIPVNNGFQETKGGVQIFVTSNAVHGDLILPISNSVFDWRGEFPSDCCRKPFEQATHIAVGWGDEGFFIGTPTWEDLKYSTAANALLIPSRTCMHVSFTKAEYYSHAAKSVSISNEQYQQLVDYILASFQTDADGKKLQIEGRSLRYRRRIL